ncbi:MAG: hypothetical protein ABIQ88_12810 [Chitinophagaceae bacterium]
MIEVFKTNIGEVSQAKQLIGLLLQHFPGSKINVDLHDCDKVLRVEGDGFLPCTIMMLVEECGFICSLLE